MPASLINNTIHWGSILYFPFILFFMRFWQDIDQYASDLGFPLAAFILVAISTRPVNLYLCQHPLNRLGLLRIIIVLSGAEVLPHAVGGGSPDRGYADGSVKIKLAAVVSDSVFKEGVTVFADRGSVFVYCGRRFAGNSENTIITIHYFLWYSILCLRCKI